MSIIALLLVSLSSLIHAGWNLLGKHRHPPLAFFFVAAITGAALLSPACWLPGSFPVRDLPGHVWGWLLATGFFMALYYAGLAAAYRSGDLSVAYPLARSSPVIVVLVVSIVLGRGDQVSALATTGIVLVVAGCFLVPLRAFGEIAWRNYLSRTFFFAMIAAIGTSGYSIIDDETLRYLRTEALGGTGPLVTTLGYGSLQALLAGAWMVIFMVFQRAERMSLRSLLRSVDLFPLGAGLAIYASYALVLIALAFADNVSYVVGFRQISIPMGALLAFLYLKEKPYRPKLAGIAIIVVGLFIIAAG